MARGVAAVVVAAVLLVTFFIMRHMGRVVDGDSTNSVGAPQGFVSRKFSSFKITAMKALPVTAIRIVVVVWQIIFQVRSPSLCFNVMLVIKRCIQRK